MPINPFLLDILCCPALHDGEVCHGEMADQGDSLLCKKCGLAYPIEDGIPVLLADQAKKSSCQPPAASKK